VITPAFADNKYLQNKTDARLLAISSRSGLRRDHAVEFPFAR